MHKEHKLHIKVAGATDDWIRVKKVGPSTPKMTLRPDMSDIFICDDKYIIFALPALINLIQKHQLPYPHVKWSLRTLTL